MYTMLDKITRLVERWHASGKITEYDLLEFQRETPKYNTPPLNEVGLRLARGYGATAQVVDGIGVATFSADKLDDVFQLVRALRTLGYNSNIIHELGASKTTVEWR